MAAPRCRTVVREECALVAVKQCEPQTETSCDTKVRIPWQEWVHQEKCLFADDGTLSKIENTELFDLEPDTSLREGRVDSETMTDHHQNQHHQRRDKSLFESNEIFSDGLAEHNNFPYTLLIGKPTEDGKTRTDLAK